MGVAKRRYFKETMDFRKTLKRPLEKIAAIMPIDFPDELFYAEFKSLYSYLWDDICAKSKEYKRRDKSLVKKGFKERYHFPSPNAYLKEISAPSIKRTRVSHISDPHCVNEEEQKKIKDKLVEKCAKKVDAREHNLQKNLEYVQSVTPKYANYYIQTYFKGKRSNPIDVDVRYTVLMEASKYKSSATIQFLHKVNASERNFHLREFAFMTLQKFGIKEVRLRKNRKGNKHAGDTTTPQEIDSPEKLLEHIYNSQLEQAKMHDLFLSHSSFDRELLLETKAILNSNGVNVYVDWVSDKGALKRELTNVDTANVIIERLKSSKALLYIHTPASSNSKWTPWELGYFHASKNKICVYYPETGVDTPPYLEIYPVAVLKDSGFVVRNASGEELSLKEWIDS